LAVAVLGVVVVSAACSSQPGPPAAAKAVPAGDGAWTDFTLYAVSPAGLTPVQKQRFQNMSMGAPGYLAGVAFENGAVPGKQEYRADLRLRGVLMREAWHRDGLSIWKMEGQAFLPAAAKKAQVLQTRVVELSTADAELSPQSFAKDYPVNQVLNRALGLAARQAHSEGVSRGKARVASMQYDSQAGRFRVRVEILAAD
jgi:hypothetical protein